MTMVKLIVQRGAKRGTEVIIRREQALLGRSRSCQICIPAPQVSRQHCAILIENGQVLVRDLGSTNGTFVNGVQISEQQLTTGDTLTIGNVVFLVRIETPGASDTAKPGDQPAIQEAEPVDAELVFQEDAETQQAAAVGEEVLDAEVVAEEGAIEAEVVEDNVLEAEVVEEDVTEFFVNMEDQPESGQTKSS